MEIECSLGDSCFLLCGLESVSCSVSPPLLGRSSQGFIDSPVF